MVFESSRPADGDTSRETIGAWQPAGAAGQGRRRKPITTFRQLMLALTMMVVITTAGVSAALYQRERHNLLAGLDGKLLADALMAHDVLPPAYHDRIDGPESVSDAEYQAIAARLNELRQAWGLEHLWSLMQIDGRLVFTSASAADAGAPHEAHADFFETHGNPKMYDAALASTTPVYQVIDDGMGRMRAVLAPFRDGQGRPYLVAACVRMDAIDRQLREVLYRCLAGGVVLFLWGLIASLLVARMVARPMRRLAGTIERIEAGDADLAAEERGTYELVRLARSFNRLNRALHDKIAELAQQEENLRITLHSIGDAVVATDDQARVTRMNPAAEALTGWQATEALGQPVSAVLTLIHAVTRKPAENPIGKALSLGQVVGLANHTALIARDGAERQIADSAAPIRDADGAVLGAVMVFRDVTEEYEMRDELARTKAFLEAALMQTPIGVMIADAPQGRIRFANKEAQRILGVAPRGLTILDQGPTAAPWQINNADGTSRALAESPLARALARGKRTAGEEIWVQRGDGSRVCVSANAAPITSAEGETIGGIVAFPDITGQKQAEETLRESQRLQGIGELAGGLAHEFNNLLTGVLSQSALAMAALPAGSAPASHIDKARQAAGRAAELTGKLLAYAGKGQFEVMPTSLNEIVQSSLSLLQTALPRTAELALALAPELAPIEADPRQLQQVVMNLAVNGGEAIGASRGQVSIRTRSCAILEETAAGWVATAAPAPGQYVCLEVSDTGAGMDAETMGRIFDPFYSTKFTGRGLGLAAVLGIVRAMHGGLRVESEPGAGSRFTVLFPACERCAGRAGKEGAGEPAGDVEMAGQTAPRPGQVLIIDDEPAVREALGDIFDLAGIASVSAADGREGVETFRGLHAGIGLVLLDLVMPVMGGEETLRKLREIDPQVPVLLSSGYDEAEVLRRLRAREVEEQPTGFLSKPYSIDEVLGRVRQVLGDA